MRQRVAVWLITTGVFAASAIVCIGQAPAQTPPPAATPAPAVPATPAQQQAAPATPDAATPEATVAGGKLHGTVKSGNVPLPGVTVTAQNTLTGKRYASTTDISGAWSMTIPQNGRYVIRTQFAAFAQGSQEALFNATSSHDQTVNFSLQLASRAAQQEQQASQAEAVQAIRQLTGSGPQNLSLMSALSGDTENAGAAGATAGGNGAALPSIAGNSDFTSNESVSINGQSGQVSPLAGMDPDRIRDAIETLRAQGGGLMQNFSGGFGGAFGGGFVMGGGGPGGGGRQFFIAGGPGGRGGPGGNFRGFNPGQPHGSIFWFGSNSALNAEPFSLRGQAQNQPASGSNRFGLTFMTAPYIPGLWKPSGKDTVFFTVSGTRSSSPTDFYETVPTDAQRAGQVSDTLTVTPVQQAIALLQYIPEPNLSGTVQNYHALTTAQSNTTQAGVRYMRSIGANATQPGFGGRGGGGGRRSQQNQGLRQSINANYNWAHSASDNVNVVPILGGKTASDSYSVQAGYTVGYKKLTNIFNASWNRSDTSNPNFFTNGTDIATQLGILGPNGQAINSDALDYGVPNVNLSSYYGISQAQPSFSISQTISLSETLAWIHGKHNLRFGGDYRRVHRDFLGQGNATGSFTFTGVFSGSALGDFLEGLPQQTSISAADQKTYLRDNVFDVYALDDWRVRNGLSFSYGIRYDFYAPYTEKYNHLSMVDTNPDGNFTNVGQISAGSTSANFGALPDSLVYPFRIGFSPRLGVAWRVPKVKQMVIRGGYGINYTVGNYGTFAANLAYQPPFVNVQTNNCASALNNTPVPCYTLADGFTTGKNIGTFSVNPHYRLPYVQAYNLDIQKTLPWGVLLNLGYNGSMGNNLDIKIAPWATASSPNTNPGQVPFYYVEDGAFYHFNAGSVRVNKRLSSGIALGANYQWSHAIDDASGVGNAGGSSGNSLGTAQNWQDPAAEAGHSSLDVRHTVSGTYLYELPFGKDKFWLTSGTASHIFEGFSVSGAFSFATGKWLNPTMQADPNAISIGTTGTQRPDLVPGQSIAAGGGSLHQWFNPNAFQQPTGSYGSAARNSILGPGTISNNMSLSKTAQLGDTRSWEIRATIDNVFNTVQYSGVNTSLPSSSDASSIPSQFGRITSVAAMRQFNFTTRFRF